MDDIKYDSTPLFTHDCNSCIFMGSYQLCDLYYHSANDILETVIARYSSGCKDYVSGMAAALNMEKGYNHINNPLVVALRRARRLGYIQ
jgi:hypothetical protein